MGPINWAANYAEGRFLIKWIAPIMRNLADSPERAAEISCNEGVADLFEVIFPPKVTLITPARPAPTNARAFVLFRMLSLFAGVLAQAVGGKMPADQETIRYTGFYGYDTDGTYFLSREVLGGGGGEFRGGLGYEKEYRSLTDCFTLVSADRVRLGCYGVNGGRTGATFGVYVDAEGDARKLGGLEDEIPIQAGELMRVTTTGGGGWGNPLDRDVDAVRMDVWQAKVSAKSAREEYGVVIARFDDDEPVIDAQATEKLRAGMRANQPDERVIIDRGPGIDAVTLANPDGDKPKRYG